MPFDPTQVSLGKKRAVYDRRALLFGNYLKASLLPYIPQAYHWAAGIPHYPMYLNDTLGCCTVAAGFHHEGVWTFKTTGHQLVVGSAEIQSVYSAVSGYVPGDPSTDVGADLLTVMKRWKSIGLSGTSADKLLAYTSIEPGNHMQFMASIFLFGGVYLGIQLPITAQAQVAPNGLWSLVPGYQTDPLARPGSWGGHAIAVVGYNQQSVCFFTWNKIMYATWGWLDYYADEAYSPISAQWLNSKGVAPNQFNLQQLEVDLAQL